MDPHSKHKCKKGSGVVGTGFDCFWLILLFWAILAVLGYFGSFGLFWALLAVFGSFGRFGLFWLILPVLGYFVYFGQFCMFWDILAVLGYFGVSDVASVMSGVTVPLRPALSPISLL